MIEGFSVIKSPKTVMITGASSGLGAALARYYAKPGVVLCLQGRDAERLSKVAQECEDLGSTVHTALIDIRARDVFFHWAQGLDHRFHIDLLIVNAGISAGSAGIEGFEAIAQAYQIFETNLTGALITIDPVLTGMVRRGHGQIALVASMASFLALPGAPAYSASKAALRLYGEALGSQLLSKGIGVSVVCPGFIKTPMTDVNDYYMPFMLSAEKAAHIISKGLSQKKALIVFPKRMFVLVCIIAALPQYLRQLLLRRAPAKKSFTN